MDLIKKFLPNQNTIQILLVDSQGFRKTINENPPTHEFFKNPEGAEHGQKCIESKKINTLYHKNLLQTQLSASEIFPVAFFGYKFLKLLQNCDWKKNDISDMVHPRKISLAESWGSSRYFKGQSNSDGISD